ncbi:unnamed protein product [Cuscuta campestris]|uniref:Retrotransposon Copia-like N-terminal domain-containing protein n=1 Tax=Cuscuta campestris TaxID=132261 RepID=A0A484KVY3_9ASTE|nr:unnamed protein product [Cuscuta campestris]
MRKLIGVLRCVVRLTPNNAACSSPSPGDLMPSSLVVQAPKKSPFLVLMIAAPVALVLPMATSVEITIPLVGGSQLKILIAGGVVVGSLIPNLKILLFDMLAIHSYILLVIWEIIWVSVFSSFWKNRLFRSFQSSCAMMPGIQFWFNDGTKGVCCKGGFFGVEVETGSVKEDSGLTIPGEGKGIGSEVILGEGKLRFLNQAGGGQQVGLVLCPGEKAKTLFDKRDAWPAPVEGANQGFVEPSGESLDFIFGEGYARQPFEFFQLASLQFWLLRGEKIWEEGGSAAHHPPSSSPRRQQRRITSPPPSSSATTAPSPLNMASSDKALENSNSSSSSNAPHLAFTTISNVKLHVPILLSFSQPNYKKWSRLFLLLVRRFTLHGFLSGSSSPSSADDDEWFQLDALIQGWILSTISDEVSDLVISTTSIAAELWQVIHALFHDNKHARAMQLEHQFRTTVKGMARSSVTGRAVDDEENDFVTEPPPDLNTMMLVRLRNGSTSVMAYQTVFEGLLNKVSGIPESTLISMYKGGLKQPLQCELNLRNPGTLAEAFALARELAACTAVMGPTKRVWQSGTGDVSSQPLVASLEGSSTKSTSSLPIIRLTPAERAERSRMSTMAVDWSLIRRVPWLRGDLVKVLGVAATIFDPKGFRALFPQSFPRAKQCHELRMKPTDSADSRRLQIRKSQNPEKSESGSQTTEKSYIRRSPITEKSEFWRSQEIRILRGPNLEMSELQSNWVV